MAEEKTSLQRRLRAVVFLAGIALIAVVIGAIVFSPPGRRRAAEKTETTAVENVEIKPDVNIREKTDDRKDRVKPNASEKLKVEVPPPPPKPESVPAESAPVAKSGTRPPEAKRKDDRRRKEAEKWRAMRDQDIVVESGGRIAKPGERTSTVTMSSAQELKVKPKAAPKKAARPAPRRPSAVGAMPGAEAGYGEPAPEESTQGDAQLPVGVGPVSDPSPTEIIDMLLERMERANIAFNAPRSMNIGDSPKIQLLLSLGDTEEVLKASIKAAGEKIGAEIRVNNRMQARLSGYMFQITAITPEEQAVSRRGRTEWSWEIHPKKEGQHDLHLTLSAIFEVNGRETRRVVKTFDRVIEVNISAPQKITAFVKGNWQWLWAAVLVPIAGWLWRQRRG